MKGYICFFPQGKFKIYTILFSISRSTMIFKVDSIASLGVIHALYPPFFFMRTNVAWGFISDKQPNFVSRRALIQVYPTLNNIILSHPTSPNLIYQGMIEILAKNDKHHIIQTLVGPLENVRMELWDSRLMIGRAKSMIFLALIHQHTMLGEIKREYVLWMMFFISMHDLYSFVFIFFALWLGTFAPLLVVSLFYFFNPLGHIWPTMDINNIYFNLIQFLQCITIQMWLA